MMSKALFNVGKEEFEDAKARLIAKKKREPTVREIRKESRTTIPRAGILRENVEAVLAYIQAKDAQTEHLLSVRRQDDDSPSPRRFLRATGTRNRIRDQFHHIDCGCLSDPPQEIINLFRYNAKRDVVFVARGTNSNERDNFDLGLRILSATHVGKFNLSQIICKCHALLINTLMLFTVPNRHSQSGATYCWLLRNPQSEQGYIAPR